MVILVFTACAISTEDKVELPGAVGKGREETGSGESGTREPEQERGSQKGFHVITGANGGLLIEYGKEIPDEVNGLQWTDTGTLTAGTTNGEMVHAGIYVHVEQDDDSERFWYPDEEAFLAANGFERGEPFFEYDMPEEPGRLVFYYDEATQAGCGIRYYERDPDTFTTTGMYGFVFKGLREDGENGIPADYDSRSEPFLWIDYEYYDNGSLKKRSYMHSGYVYGSAYTTWNSYFDERGRIVYEDIYITHGSLDKYYIYMDDTEEPSYILDVDNCAGEWIPEFWKAK